MSKLLYFFIQIFKTIIYVLIGLLYTVYIILLICSVMIIIPISNVISFLQKRFISPKLYLTMRSHYQLMATNRCNDTNKQFIQACEIQGIDPFVAKVFWNFCQEGSFIKKYPYKPRLEDALELLDESTLKLALENTMYISCYRENFDYSEAQDIKDVLLLLSNE